MMAIHPEEARALDENAEFLGISRLQLMENAGKGVIDSLQKRMDLQGKKVLVLSYTGNKGGDGFVVARHLSYYGSYVDLIMLSKPDQISTEEARKNFLIIEKLSHSISLHIAPTPSDLILLKEKFDNADVIIDAMLGTGAKGEPKEPIKTALELCNKSKAYKVAIDVPTGVDPATGAVSKNAFKAHLTVTHHRPKLGLLNEAAKKLSGEIEIVNIGIPPEAELYAGPGDLRIAMKPRDPYSHKGDNGRVLVVGGSFRYVGAPTLAAMAALKTGVDLAVVAAPSSIAQTIRSFSPDLIVQPLPSQEVLDIRSIDTLKQEAERSDAVVLGMGLGTDPKTKEAVRAFIEYLNSVGKPTVIDADALKVLGEIRDELRFKNAVLTPHAGEFYILTGEKLPDEREVGWRGRLDTVMRWASKFGATILLKSRYDIITDGNRFKIKTIGNPGLTVGGTGDVLSGIVGAFVSKGIDPYRSAVAGSFLNSFAGDIVAMEKGYHYTARDLVEKIPDALKRFGL
ncbi:MAG: NAD(P)H-hydrate dehydratase [Candidatus Methanomethylicaceae archaeon]|nr:NAD(P)H-hydrate dehydratase [Candidatus Verstraetearchaeota archaeon]